MENKLSYYIKTVTSGLGPTVQAVCGNEIVAATSRSARSYRILYHRPLEYGGKCNQLNGKRCDAIEIDRIPLGTSEDDLYVTLEGALRKQLKEEKGKN